MSIAAAWPQCLAFFGTPLVMEPSPAQLSGDAVLLTVHQSDPRIGLTQELATALKQARGRGRTDHSFLEIVRSRVCSILTGYEDHNNHDAKRCGPPSNLSRSARRGITTLPGLIGFPSTTSPMKREWACRRGPCALVRYAEVNSCRSVFCFDPLDGGRKSICATCCGRNRRRVQRSSANLRRLQGTSLIHTLTACVWF